MKKFRILCMADLAASPGALAPLQAIAEVVQLPANRESLLARIGDFDIYIASLHIQFDSEFFDRATRLKAIATPSTGLDHIDTALAIKRNIQILSLKEETDFLDSVTATAELAWALLLATVRRLPWAFAEAQKGHWARDEFRGHQLSSKTLGILGYGRLGKIVAEYGKAFRMRVIACDKCELSPAPGVQMVGFETLLAESDVLSLHIHLTPENRGLLDSYAFAKTRTGAVLINTSRGAIIDETALLQALESGRLAGAGLDVIDGEWSTDLASHPLIRYANSHDNLLISPHIGGVTWESQAMTLEFMVQKLKTYLTETSPVSP